MFPDTLMVSGQTVNLLYAVKSYVGSSPTLGEYIVLINPK